MIMAATEAPQSGSKRCRRRKLSAFGLIALLCSMLVCAPGWAYAGPSPVTALNTDLCPFRENPPPAVDSSEAPRDGHVPTALPVPDAPIGGPGLGGCSVITPQHVPAPPAGITSSSWLVADLSSGNVIAAKDPHGRYRPASTIKLLLAYTVVQNLPLDRVVYGDKSDEKVEGDHLGVTEGSRYTVLQLLEGLLLVSGNDAAMALARALGGTEKTLQLMNDNAYKLQARDTRAASPSGLDAPGMSTSAYDLALILRADLNVPAIRTILSLHNAVIPASGNSPQQEIYSQNSFAMHDPGSIGGKTGYTDDAQKTFVGAVKRKSRNLIVVQMYGLSVKDDSYWNQADKLLNWAGSLDRSASIGTLVGPMDFKRSAGVIATPNYDTATNRHSYHVPAKTWLAVTALVAIFIALTWLLHTSRRALTVYQVTQPRKNVPVRREVRREPRARKPVAPKSTPTRATYSRTATYKTRAPVTEGETSLQKTYVRYRAQ